MLLSIRKIFFNLKFALLIILAGTILLAMEMLHISSYSDRLNALKNQHAMIDKVVKVDFADLGMANIVVHSALGELDLSIKRSGEEELFDSFISSNEEQASLLRSLSVSSTMFKEATMEWIVTPPAKREEAFKDVLSARTVLQTDIDHMIDYQIQCTVQAVTTAKMSAFALLLIAAITLLLYWHRLTQISKDIEKACAVDIDGSQPNIMTEEIDFVMKRLSRRSSQPIVNPALLHPMSSLNNQKGMLSVFNAKRAGKSGNTIFLCLFRIDGYAALHQNLSAEEIGGIYKKLGEIISLYEQPLDVIAHLDDDSLVFILSRNSKDIALDECNKIVESVAETPFGTAKEMIKITLSAGFLLKAPVKSLDDVIKDAGKLIEIAQENGGNRVAQLRDRVDAYR